VVEFGLIIDLRLSYCLLYARDGPQMDLYVIINVAHWWHWRIHHTFI